MATGTLVKFLRWNVPGQPLLLTVRVTTFRGFGRALQRARRLGKCAAADLRAVDGTGAEVWAANFPRKGA